MSGGEIFHEMMLRLDVKHICKSTMTIRMLNADLVQSVTLVVRSSPFSMPSTTRSSSNSFSPDTNKAQATWLRVMPRQLASPVLSW